LISYIRGILAEKTPARIVIETAGVGYEVLVPLSSYDALPRVGDELLIHTHHHVREDVQQLYGFATERERQIFRMLISVSGIGPRLALGILSGASVDGITDAIVREEVEQLTLIPGIGKKTAQRLIVELKGRIAEEEAMVVVGGGVAAADSSARQAVEALIALGFTRATSKKAVEKAAGECDGKPCVEELVRSALRHT
jgi:Holliday junction DNA helicase RuvA